MWIPQQGCALRKQNGTQCHLLWVDSSCFFHFEIVCSDASPTYMTWHFLALVPNGALPTDAQIFTICRGRLHISCKLDPLEPQNGGFRE